MGLQVPALSEPVFIQDTFATELAAVCEIDGNFRFTWATLRPQIGLIPAERVVVCHLVLTPSASAALRCGPKVAALLHPHAQQIGRA